MTVDDFYAKLGLPDKAKLGARLFKKQLLDNAELSSADRQLITDQVDTLEWRYAIKPATVAIARYDDDERDYGEIALLHIELKNSIPVTQLKRLGELLQRAIQYPLILIVVANEVVGAASDNSLEIESTELNVVASAPSATQITSQLAICMADKRINRADTSKLTIFRTVDTGWLKLGSLNLIEQAFIADFSFSTCSQQHLFSLYADFARCITALACARITGQYHRSTTDHIDQQRQEIVQAMRQVEGQLASQHAMLKAETQFNRQLTLNVQIKQLQQTMSEYTVQLINSK